MKLQESQQLRPKNQWTLLSVRAPKFFYWLSSRKAACLNIGDSWSSASLESHADNQFWTHPSAEWKSKTPVIQSPTRAGTSQSTNLLSGSLSHFNVFNTYVLLTIEWLCANPHACSVRIHMRVVCESTCVLSWLDCCSKSEYSLRTRANGDSVLQCFVHQHLWPQRNV